MGTVRIVAVNERGCRIGEDHHRAKLSNAQVDEIFRLQEEEGWGQKRLAKHFKVSRRTIRWILAGKHRVQYPHRFKTITID